MQAVLRVVRSDAICPDVWVDLHAAPETYLVSCNGGIANRKNAFRTRSQEGVANKAVDIKTD